MRSTSECTRSNSACSVRRLLSRTGERCSRFVDFARARARDEVREIVAAPPPGSPWPRRVGPATCPLPAATSTAPAATWSPSCTAHFHDAFVRLGDQFEPVALNRAEAPRSGALRELQPRPAARGTREATTSSWTFLRDAAQRRRGTSCSRVAREPFEVRRLAAERPSTRRVTGSETNGKTQRLIAETAASSGSTSSRTVPLRLFARSTSTSIGASPAREMFDELLAQAAALVEHLVHDQRRAATDCRPASSCTSGAPSRRRAPVRSATAAIEPAPARMATSIMAR